MTIANQMIIEAFGRVQESVHQVVQGLSSQELAHRSDAEANSIGWLVWHLTRVQDDHIADVAGTEQVWTSEGWAARFDLPFDRDATGYGQSTADVAAVRVKSVDLLAGYYDAVHQKTCSYLEGLTDDDYGRVVDEQWDPPVTLGARLVSVVNDDTQHVGQATFIRGLIERARPR